MVENFLSHRHLVRKGTILPAIPIMIRIYIPRSIIRLIPYLPDGRLNLWIYMPAIALNSILYIMERMLIRTEYQISRYV